MEIYELDEVCTIKGNLLAAYVTDTVCIVSNSDCNTLTKYISFLECQLEELQKRNTYLESIVERVNIEALDEAEGAMDIAMKRIEELEAYADKLAQGLPVGMLPKDIENVRQANVTMACKIQELEAKLAEAKSLITDLHITEIWAIEKLPTHWRSDCPMSVFELNRRVGMFEKEVE